MRPTSPKRLLLPLIILGVATCFGGPTSWAEGPFDRTGQRPRFEHLGAEDGLPHDVVFTLALDATGFLWMGTQGGPTRYDGVDFVPWRHHPDDPDSIALDDVSLILPDDDRGLWFATWGGGLDYFDLDSERFEHLPARPGQEGYLQDGRVQTLFVEADRVWAGTFDGGLSLIDRRQGVLSTLRHDPDDRTSLPDDRVWSITRDAAGRLWIGTHAGLCHLEEAPDHAPSCDVVPLLEGGSPDVESEAATDRSTEIRALLSDRQGRLWAGTGAGVFLRSRPGARFEPFRPEGFGLGADIVNVFFEDSLGDLWIGTNGDGLVRCSGGSERCERFVHRADDPTSPTSDDVRALLEDDAGTLWIATRGGGVDRLALSPPPFRGLVRQPSGPLPSSYVWSFAQDLEGRIWVGTGRGLLRAEGRAFTHFSADAPPGGDPAAALPDGHVSDLLVDRGGGLWIATFDGGLARFLGDDRGFHTYRHDPTQATSLPSNHIHRVYQSSDDTIWVGTRQGLARYRPSSDDFLHFRSPASGSEADQAAIRDDVVREILEDPGGFLWIGTDDAGLFRLWPESGERKHLVTSPGSVGERIHDLHLDAGDGTLWIATDLGLAHRRDDGSIELYSDRQGLPTPHVLSIRQDGRGNLWLGTDRGLARLDPESERVLTFRSSDGLPGDAFNSRAAFSDRDGRMYFGGIDGLTVFEPGEILEPRNTAPVVLTGFYRFNRPTEMERPPSALREIVLPPTDDFISFTFAHLNFNNPTANRYRYLLDGFDRGWVDAGSRRRADYTNLDPGDYVFRVEAANSHGVWSEESLAIRLQIAPPIWHTWWFRLLSALLLLGLVWGTHLSRVAVLREQERRLQRRVSAALSELDASEQRYRQLFERNLAGVVRVDQEGEVLDCNEAFAHIFGFESTRRCLEGRVNDLKPGTALRRQLERSPTIAGFEQTTRRRDGSQIVLLWNASLVRGESTPPTIEATVIDITELRRTEDTLLRTKKLESLGLMAGGVAHDFNNLLMVITGASEMLGSQLSGDADAELLSYLQMIRQATDRASKLSQQMLVYVGQGGEDHEPVDLSALIEELSPGLEVIAGRCRLELELATGLPPVLADAGQLRQVVTQLVTNAAEASEAVEAPMVRITTHTSRRSDEELEQALFEHLPAAGPYVELAVTDRGTGMDQSTRSRMFDPFFTTKFTGRGLGLAVVWGITRAHDGALEVESKPGIGTTIRLLLPAQAT